MYAPVVELYEPINTLKPVGEDLWVADGPIVRMAYLGASIPFPTRMVVARLASGGFFLWSPTEPDGGLCSEVDALGPVAHLVSPNKIHYAHIAAWKRAHPGATAWASPGARERAASQGADVTFDADLGDEPEGAWSEDLDQLVFRGSRFMEEVVFFHRATRTLILADLIENFEPGKVGGGVAVAGTVGRRGGPGRQGADRPAPDLLGRQGSGPGLVRADGRLESGEGDHGPRALVRPERHRGAAPRVPLAGSHVGRRREGSVPELLRTPSARSSGNSPSKLDFSL